MLLLLIDSNIVTRTLYRKTTQSYGKCRSDYRLFTAQDYGKTRIDAS